MTRSATSTRRARKLSAKAVAVLGAVVLVLAACGDGGGTTPPAGGGGTTTPPAGGGTTPPAGGGGTPEPEPAQANHYPDDAGFEHTYDAIVAAAIEEPALHDCNSFRDHEWPIFYQGFRDMFPEIKEIEVSNCQGSGPRERIFAEWIAGRYDVDIIDMASDFILQFQEADMGSKPDFSVFDGTPLEVSPETLDPEWRLFGIGATSQVIVYNEDLISYDELPESLYDCGDPQWADQMIVDVRPSTTYMLFPHLYGDEETVEYARRIQENRPLWARSTAPINTALLQGERPFACGTQLHGPLAGFIEWADDGVIPEGQVLNAKAPTDNAHTSSRVTGLIAKYPNAPNTALLWAAYMLSGPGLDPVNPGYGDPWNPTAWKNQWFLNQGVTPNETPGGRWNDAEPTTHSTNLIVGVWGDISPERS